MLPRAVRLLFGLLLAFSVSAQINVPVISGQVIDALSGKPVKRAQVLLRSRNAKVEATTPTTLGVTTDEKGQFAFFDLTDGYFAIVANREGFLPSRNVALGNQRLAFPLKLEKRSTLNGLTIRMTPAAVIAGKIRHSDGEFAVNITVDAYRERFRRGSHVFEHAGRAQTNDRGEYRIFNLAAGRYYATALVSPFAGTGQEVKENYARDAAGNRIPPERSVSTFFPSTWKLSEAVAFEVKAGQEVGNIDITLARAHASSLIVTAISSETGAKVSGPTLELDMPDSTGTGFLRAEFAIRSGTDGVQEIHDVLPGTYELVASASENGKALHTRQVVSAGEGLETQVLLTLFPVSVLNGKLQIEGDDKAQLDGVRVLAEPRRESVGRETARVNADGTFTLRLVPAERYDLSLVNTNGNIYLKSGSLGSDDLLGSGLKLTGPPAAMVILQADTRGGQITGLTAPGATVLLLPEDARLHKYQFTTANEYGYFQFLGLAPGDYYTISWVDQAPCEYYDTLRLAACFDQGAKISIQPGRSELISLAPSDAKDTVLPPPQ